MHRSPPRAARPSQTVRSLLACLLIALLAGGCAVHRTIVHEGRMFPTDRIPGIDVAWRGGLDREGVRALLGLPYATGVDEDGYPYWHYRYRGQSTTSGGGGLLVVGVVASQAATGAEIRLAFDAAGRVRRVVWEIAGPDAYRAMGSGAVR